MADEVIDYGRGSSFVFVLTSINSVYLVAGLTGSEFYYIRNIRKNADIITLTSKN